MAQRQILDIPGGRTAYIESGSGPAPALVMVHGVGLNASVWTPQLQDFADARRVVAYDTLGHGESDLPPDDADLADYLDQLRDLLAALELGRPVLLGHSMGALIATRFAIDHPQRVAAVIAVNPVYRRPAEQLAVSRARARELEQRGSQAALDEALVRWFGDNGALDTEQVARVRRWISGANPRGYARAYQVFSEADPWLAGRLEALEVPALFVTGELDPNSTPAMAEAMAAEAPRGRVHVLEGERHMMAYASPARFNRVVREFIDGLAERETAPRVLSDRQARRA